MPPKLERGYVANRVALEMDNTHAGWVQSAEGGVASSDIVAEKVGGEHVVHKHAGPVKYDDISLRCGAGMSRAFYDWIGDSIGNNHKRQDGAIIAGDYNFSEVARLEFTQALVTEFALPALDAQSKDAAVLSVKFAPETTRMKRGSGGKLAGSAHPVDPARQKRWLPSNFRLKIDGVDGRECARVNKVDAISVKQKLVEIPQSENRDAWREPAALEYSNLVITLPEAQADSFWAWHEDYIIKGKRSDNMEKTGSLEFLDSSLKEVLVTVNFDHLGVFKLTPDKLDTGASSVRMVKVEMYCETMKFKFGNQSVWA